MFLDMEELCENATNVYRTNKYIVKQSFCLECNDAGEVLAFSKDVFYARNKLRDFQYERAFANREFINGKRIPTMSFSRRYIK